MDPDELRDEAEGWVDEGIITPQQAAEIMAQYDQPTTRTGGGPGAQASEEGPALAESRLVVGLAIVGAVLIGAGVVLFLATQWSDLPVALRTLIVLATPVAAMAAGEVLAHERSPRVGAWCWILGVLLTGPCAILLFELHAPGLDPEWPLLAWALVAIPAAYYRASAVILAIGLLVATGFVGIHEGSDGVSVAMGGLAAVLVAVGAAHEPIRARLGSVLEEALPERVGGAPATVGAVYRLVAVVAAAVPLLVFSLSDGNLARVGVSLSPIVYLAGIGALLAVPATMWLDQRGHASRADVHWVGLVVVVNLLVVALVIGQPDVSAALVFLLIHAFLLAVVVASVLLAAAVRSRWIVNLVAVVVLLQVLAFMLSTVLAALSGALALIVAGIVVLAIALALERSRRELIDRFALDAPTD